VVRCFVAGLAASQLHIIEGISGTGKTSLPLAFAEAIDAPVAVIAGSRSAPIRREVARALAGLLGSATLNELDAGHLVPVEAPEAVASAVAEVAAR
nr:hypothetical protein [Thermoleophilaceae bacterium]